MSLSTFPTPGKPKEFLASCTVSFRKSLSSAEMTALQTQIQTLWPDCGVTYTGSALDYLVTVTGPADNFRKAVALAMPLNRTDIIVQPASLTTAI